MLETFIHAAPSSALSSLPYGHSQQHVTFRTLSQGQPFWRMASGKEVIPTSPASQLYLPHFSSKQHVLRYPKVSPRINTSRYLRSRTIWKSGGQMSYSLRAEGSFPPCPTTPRELAELPAGRKQAAPLGWELSTHRAQHHSSRRACLLGVTAKLAAQLSAPWLSPWNKFPKTDSVESRSRTCHHFSSIQISLRIFLNWPLASQFHSCPHDKFHRFPDLH